MLLRLSSFLAAKNITTFIYEEKAVWSLLMEVIEILVVSLRKCFKSLVNKGLKHFYISSYFQYVPFKTVTEW